MSCRLPRSRLLLVLAICWTCACGLNSNDEPEVLAPGALPEGILEEPTTTADCRRPRCYFRIILWSNIFRTADLTLLISLPLD